jgi:hypothetical protein
MDKMTTIFGLSTEIWAGAILGAIIGVIFTILLVGARRLTKCWIQSRPRVRVLGPLADNNETCTIFVRDFYLPEGSHILSVEPRYGVGTVPNVHELWPDVEGRGVGYVFNALGQVGKRRNISIVRMSQDPGIWNTNIIVMGAQAQKCFDFYDRLEGVMYSVDVNNIFEKETGAIVQREDGYGYGIILKARNPYKTGGVAGAGFLIGGYGTLGTAASAYYFREHLEELGKRFGSRCFGVVVRASITAGEQSVERLPQYDRVEKVTGD